MTMFPKVMGRLPTEVSLNDLTRLGRVFARLHNVGSQAEAQHRPTLDNNYYGGGRTLDDLERWIAPEVKSRYFEAADLVLDALDEELDGVQFLRIHGDCHRGNVLDDEKSLFLIDFDDFINGPAVSDLWMLLSWDPETINAEKDSFLKGYEELREWNDDEWSLVGPLRGMRIIMYAGWIAARWDDPTFRRLFPQFETYQYWAEDVEALERIAWSL